MPTAPSPPARPQPPRAAAFIVTLYGDVVEPRGGVFWMGSLIEVCAGVGISETLARTAVSRLVAAGQLEGERLGRRSYYRLAAAAQREFRAAAEVIFAPPEAEGPQDWLWLIDPSPAAAEALALAGFAEVGAGLWLGPERDGLPVGCGAVFRSRSVAGQEALARFAARHWDLDGRASAYRSVLDRHGAILDGAGGLAPREALLARLRLIHDYRSALLRDPGLPAGALPPDWPGPAVRRFFARAYAALSPATDAEIGRSLAGANGPLPAATPETRARLARLTSQAVT